MWRSSLLVGRYHAPPPAVCLFHYPVTCEVLERTLRRLEAPHREEYYEKLIAGVLQGFDDCAHPKVLPNQIFFLFDGFKHGLSSDLLRVFKDEKTKRLEGASKIVYCQYDPATLNDRRPLD